jgi:hypothetical protein
MRTATISKNQCAVRCVLSTSFMASAGRSSSISSRRDGRLTSHWGPGSSGGLQMRHLLQTADAVHEHAVTCQPHAQRRAAQLSGAWL